MNTVKRVTAALAMGLFLSSPAIADDAKSVEWLYVHTAETAKMLTETQIFVPAKTDIFAFSDRPNRQHFYINAYELASMWDKDFKDSAPNAVLTWVDAGVVQEAEVIISAAEAQRNGEGILYTVQFEVGSLPANSTVSHVSMFIDDVCIGICGNHNSTWF